MGEQSRDANDSFSARLRLLEDSVSQALDKRFDDYNSRLGEQHKCFRFILMFIGFILVGVQEFLAFYQIQNVSQQREDLLKLQKDLKNEIESALGKSKELPEIEVYDFNGQPIHRDSVIEADVEVWTAHAKDEDDTLWPFLFDAKNQYKLLRIDHMIKNVGNAPVKELVAFFIQATRLCL